MVCALLLQHKIPPMLITGEHIRMLRLIKGLKQETVAKKLGISQPAYCKLEKSEVIDMVKLEQLMTALQCCQKDILHVNEMIDREKEAL